MVLLGLMINLGMAGSSATAGIPTVSNAGFRGVGTMTKHFVLCKSVLHAEILDPAAPVAQHGVAYVRDNGAGRMQLVVRFPTGAVQVIATEP